MRVVLPAVFLTVSFAAQTTPPTDKNRIRREGTVVSVTGELVQKATLTLQRRDGARTYWAHIAGHASPVKLF